MHVNPTTNYCLAGPTMVNAAKLTTAFAALSKVSPAAPIEAA